MTQFQAAGAHLVEVRDAALNFRNTGTAFAIGTNLTRAVDIELMKFVEIMKCSGFISTEVDPHPHILSYLMCRKLQELHISH